MYESFLTDADDTSVKFKGMLQEKKDIIKILKPIFKDSGVLFCYLFGSFANNNNISKSDVDLVFYFN